MHSTLSDGRLARAECVTAMSVRYYDARGLLPRAERAENGYPHYAADSADRLAFIQRAKSLGLTLEEIRQLISATDDARCDLLTPELQHLLARKLADCDRRIAELTAFRAALAGAAERLQTGVGACAVADDCACSAYQQDCECLPNVATPLDIAVRGRV